MKFTMPSTITRLITRKRHLILPIFLAFLVLPAVIFAQEMQYQEHIDARAPDVVQNQSKYVGNQWDESVYSITDSIVGATTSDGQAINNGAIPKTVKMVAWIMTAPPAKTSEYAYDVMRNFGLAEPAYAQGVGFSALTPVLSVWKAFRNLAYFLFIIIFIVVGFMIMLRHQINPQTVVTIQSALPQMVVTLLLITFSYAIAGFVIDMIYLSIFVMTSLLQTFGVLADANRARDAIFGFNVFRIGWQYLAGQGQMTGQAAAAITSIVETVINFRIISWITEGLANLIIAIMIMVAMFRTLFTLITAYVGIIMSVIFAPLQLLMNAFPGSNTFNSWLRGIVANAAAFPAAAMMLILGALLTGGDATALGIAPQAGVGYHEGQSGWVPPLISSYDNETGPAAIRAIVGLGVILMLPEVLNMIKAQLQVKDGATSGVGDKFKAGWGMVAAPIGMVVGAGWGIGQSAIASKVATGWERRSAERDAARAAAANKAAAGPQRTHGQYNKQRVISGVRAPQKTNQGAPAVPPTNSRGQRF